MAKKILSLILVVICVVFGFWGVKYVRESGLFDPYSEREYLTDEEEELRAVYQSLSDDEKALYTALYRGISKNKSKIRLPFDADEEMYQKIYCLLEKQEGELFNIAPTYYTASKIKTANMIYRIENKSEARSCAAELDRVADEILSEIPDNADDYHKLLYIHDRLINDCTYDVESEMGGTAYGCLVEKRARCEGYAKAFGMLAGRLGIRTIFLTGSNGSGQLHAWNQVELDGKWYNADVTWDDTDDKMSPRYVYFLVDDEHFYSESSSDGGKETHVLDDEYVEPKKCDSNNSYYIREGCYAQTLDDADAILRRAAIEKKKSVEINFADDEVHSAFIDEYVNGGKIFDIIIEKGGDTSEITFTHAEYEGYNTTKILFD